MGNRISSEVNLKFDNLTKILNECHDCFNELDKVSARADNLSNLIKANYQLDDMLGLIKAKEDIDNNISKYKHFIKDIIINNNVQIIDEPTGQDY